MCYSFHPTKTKTHLEGGNYYIDKLVFSKCLRIVVIVTVNTLTAGTICVVSLNITRTESETRITCMPVLYDTKPLTTNWVLSCTDVFCTQAKIVVSVLFSFVILTERYYK